MADLNQNNENKEVEIRVMIKGNDAIASKIAKTFEEATDLAVEALKKQLVKSTEEQNLERQIDELTEAGCERILTEKESGSVYDRPVLQTMMEMIGEGDIIVISELTRLSRSTKDPP